MCGGLATTPLVLSVVGWFSHWNAYINLTLLLGSVVLWLTNLYALREALRAPRSGADPKDYA